MTTMPDRYDNRILAAMISDADRTPSAIAEHDIERRLARTTLLRWVFVLPAAVGVGAIVGALVLMLQAPGGLNGNLGAPTEPPPSSGSATVMPTTSASPFASVGASTAGEAEAIASQYILSQTGEVCQGGSDITIVVDRELLDRADHAASAEQWLQEDRVWLGTPEGLMRELGAERIAGASAPGHVWIAMSGTDGLAAQHLEERVTPGGKSMWVLTGRIVPATSPACG
jgi:hypothetical protein